MKEVCEATFTPEYQAACPQKGERCTHKAPYVIRGKRLCREHAKMLVFELYLKGSIR